MCNGDDQLTNEPYVQPFMLTPHIQVAPADAAGVSYLITVDTGRGSDEAVTYMVDGEQLQQLTLWVQAHRGGGSLSNSPEKLIGEFATKLDAALKGYGKGAKLCRYLGITDMRLYHWRQAHSLPSTEYLLRICKYFKWPIAETLYLVNTERAARTYYRYITVDKPSEELDTDNNE